jgi:sulfide:quinone oxidoreductase
MRVVIAGGGVAGLEAMLALRALAGDRVEIELLCPIDRFVYRPLLVAEPFGHAPTTIVDLASVVADSGADHRRDSLQSVELGARVVHTRAGARIEYDALLIALGAQPVEVVPGALTFGAASERARFAELLGSLGRRGFQRVAFVVPREATWTIAAYELALLTAAERDVRGLRSLELMLVTAEESPLQPLGVAAAELIAARLDEAGVELRLAAVVERFADQKLDIADDASLGVDRVVALPALEVSRLPGLPQGKRGFVRTDAGMHVAGLEAVWAAGDVTSFPVKQGGLAAQQADIAARSIAARAGAHVPIEPFQPLLRAALITGGEPEFLRARLDDPGAVLATEGSPLWFPTTKLAASYLGPYLARSLGAEPTVERLVDLDQPESDDAEEEHERAVRLLLATADVDASHGDFEAALRWLSLVEQLSLVVPTDYVARRDEWRRRLDPERTTDPAARRLGPRFASADEAISDLRRRVGWLRATSRRSESEMAAHLQTLDADIESVKALARRTGVLSAQDVEPKRPSSGGTS